MSLLNPYNPTLGTAPLLGHQPVFDRIYKELTKPTPSHVSLIGPKYSGKSTILACLAERLRALPDAWAVVLWDLRYETPQSDADFKQMLGNKICEQLRLQDHQTAKDLADLLVSIEGSPSVDDLATVFNAVQSEKKRIVILFDNHDKAIEQDGLTENLWSHMEFFANIPSVKFVATSLLPLAETSFKREIQVSPYWRKYVPVIRLEAFGSEDWPGFFEPFSQNGLSIDAPAQKEVANWSGGVPILAAELAKRLFEQAQKQSGIGKADVDALAQTLLSDDNCRGILKNVWRSMDDPSSQGHFLEASEGRAKISEWSRDSLDFLLRRGLVVKQGADIKGNCRLLSQWSQHHAGASSALRDAFGKAESYEANFPELLQLRLSQITSLDTNLRKAVARVLANLEDPEMALSGLRTVFDEAMRCLWAAETGGTRRAPEAWRAALGDRLAPDGKLPDPGVNRGNECFILDTITGKQNTSSIAKHATKPTFILAQCVKSTGDFLNHTGGVAVAPAFANAACLAAVELCESLARDLTRAS